MKTIGLRFIRPETNSIQAFVAACDELQQKTRQMNFIFLVPENLVAFMATEIRNHGVAAWRSGKKEVKLYDELIDCTGVLAGLDESKKQITALKHIAKHMNLREELIDQVVGKHLVIEGVMNPCDGYGSSTEQLLLALDRSGVHVQFIPMEVNNTHLSHPRINELVTQQVSASKYILYHTPTVTGQYGHAHDNKMHKSILTMFESSKIPSLWPKVINDNYDQLIVPSNFCKSVFTDCGVTVPTQVLKLGLDTSLWPLLARSESRPFTFLMYANANWDDHRKNYALTLRAFEKAFSSSKDVRLILKTTHPVPGLTSKSNVTFLSGKYDHQQLLDLLAIADCFVFPSKGEGYGLPPREAMATGIPAIVTDWSGLSDIAMSSIAYPVEPSGFEKAHCETFLVKANNGSRDLGGYATIDSNRLAEVFAHVASNRDEAKEKGLLASQFITNNESIDTTVSQISFAKPPKDMAVGYFSTWNIRCGIAVYTKHLYEALQRKNIPVFAYTHDTDLTSLLHTLIKDRVTVLNIQYEPSIMPSQSALIIFIKKARSLGIRVGLTIHSETSLLKQLVQAVDFCIVHKHSSIESLANATFVPMAVPVFNPSMSREALRAQYGFEPSDKIITTTGFAFRWKNFPDVLAHLAPYIRSRPNYKVQLLTSVNDVNPPECQGEIARVQQIIQSHGLQNQVVHVTDFVSQEELSNRLYISDVGYLWSGIQTSSSSAAGKEFITARLPLVITESNHYHDLTTGTVKTRIDHAEFARTIIETLDKDTLMTQLRADMTSLYDEINYDAMLNKHIEIFKK